MGPTSTPGRRLKHHWMSTWSFRCCASMRVRRTPGHPRALQRENISAVLGRPGGDVVRDSPDDSTRSRSDPFPAEVLSADEDRLFVDLSVRERAGHAESEPGASAGFPREAARVLDASLASGIECVP